MRNGRISIKQTSIEKDLPDPFRRDLLPGMKLNLVSERTCCCSSNSKNVSGGPNVVDSLGPWNVVEESLTTPEFGLIGIVQDLCPRKRYESASLAP